MRTLRCTLVVTVVISLAPPHLITKCSDQTYRQANLAECNMSSPPGHGGAGGGRRGLLGLGIGPL